MVVSDRPKHLREAGIPKGLGRLGSCADWNIKWNEVADELLGKGASRDVFRALVALGGKGTTEDIQHQLKQDEATGSHQQIKRIQNYLKCLIEEDSERAHDFFTYDSDREVWAIAAQCTGGSGAGKYSGLQEAALRALRLGPPCYPRVRMPCLGS